MGREWREGRKEDRRKAREGGDWKGKGGLPFVDPRYAPAKDRIRNSL